MQQSHALALEQEHDEATSAADPADIPALLVVLLTMVHAALTSQVQRRVMCVVVIERMLDGFLICDCNGNVMTM